MALLFSFGFKIRHYWKNELAHRLRSLKPAHHCVWLDIFPLGYRRIKTITVEEHDKALL